MIKGPGQWRMELSSNDKSKKRTKKLVFRVSSDHPAVNKSNIYDWINYQLQANAICCLPMISPVLTELWLCSKSFDLGAWYYPDSIAALRVLCTLHSLGDIHAWLIITLTEWLGIDISVLPLHTHEAQALNDFLWQNVPILFIFSCPPGSHSLLSLHLIFLQQYYGFWAKGCHGCWSCEYVKPNRSSLSACTQIQTCLVIASIVLPWPVTTITMEFSGHSRKMFPILLSISSTISIHFSSEKSGLEPGSSFSSPCSCLDLGRICM